MIRLTAVVSGGMFLDGYILGIIGTVIGLIKIDLSMSVFWEGAVASAALVGIFFGGPLGGWLTDKFGRKLLFSLDLLLFTVGSVVQFFADTPSQLFVIRLVMGMAIGADYSIGWPLQAEFSPRHLRGKLLAVQEVIWYVGFVFAYIMGYFMVNTWHVDWRIILGSSTLPAVILLVARIGLPESPRWLMQQKRNAEAIQIAQHYLEDPDDIADLSNEKVNKGSFGMLFNRQNRRNVFFISIFWFCAITPEFAIATFAVSILEKYGLSDGLLGAIVINGAAVIGVMVSVLVIERVGRRRLTIGPQWICAVVLVAIGVWTGAPPMLVLVGFFLFSFFNAMYTALTGVYPGEVLPTEIRGLGTGFACSVSRIGAGLGTFLMPWSMTHLGGPTTMVIAAMFCVVGAVVSQKLAPEMTGRALSDTARIQPVT
ncbi:MFS transporter [Mycobacterium dioxanotrophicus]|uniref:MFS transporter n=1 Tax=Mycobacterium dioxanotrophicus TaxID=482462 RepID=A0A1Y0CFQ3_9MYCO|nr:MFS transporter [Mycobacterium dioxanotrophicus]